MKLFVSGILFGFIELSKWTKKKREQRHWRKQSIKYQTKAKTGTVANNGHCSDDRDLIRTHTRIASHSHSIYYRFYCEIVKE